MLLPLVLFFSSVIRKLFNYLRMIPPPILSLLFFVFAFCIPGDTFLPVSYDSTGHWIVMENLESELREITISIAFVIWAYSILKFRVKEMSNSCISSE